MNIVNYMKRKLKIESSDYMKYNIEILIKSILAGIMIGIGGTIYLSLDDKIVDLNDKDDEPLNISYSKLKKMVEEIIAEQEKESDDTDDSKLNSENISTSNSSISNNKEDIEPNIVPNLDPNTVESIKQLDEDEDDVWKF